MRPCSDSSWVSSCWIASTSARQRLSLGEAENVVRSERSTALCASCSALENSFSSTAASPRARDMSAGLGGGGGSVGGGGGGARDRGGGGGGGGGFGGGRRRGPADPGGVCEPPEQPARRDPKHSPPHSPAPQSA